ncbi:MAG: XRE family transcriptional regulator [Caldilinea sp. CFX5]|nr:XRE family transcriptional regulator [Caldilinea sp. CFX5]
MLPFFANPFDKVDKDLCDPETPMSRSATVKHDVIAAITNFGDLLRYLRQRAHLTQRDLALAVGYSISQISRLEHNERLPDELTLLSVFVPALGLAQEPATVERFLSLARRGRREAEASPLAPAPARAITDHDHPAPQAARCAPTLPHRLTSFIGRDQEISALQRLIQAQRLVTLTGVGGVGKSSLALAVANTLAFPDGVWLLELASITEGGMVARSLMDLFQLPELPGRTPLEVVTAYLQHKTLLLLVDNCEHLIATCAAMVDRLLCASATLHIVATSREALNIAGEYEWPLLPFATPPAVAPDGSAWSLAQLQPYVAAQLFIERTQATKADLRFTDQDAPLIAHLCQQVDGLPLALELAAARCKSFALAELVARLQDRFTLLSAGRRTALLRHQTLRATIDWSYDLLTPAEAALFRSVSVFAGGWTVAAAEQVADSGQGQPLTFDLLHQLVNKSLVIVEQRGATTRYRMLETIRQYAGEKLREEGETETVRARHFACYLALAEQALPANLLGARFEQWFNAVRADLENLRAAFAWSLTQADDRNLSLRLATALGPFWQFVKNFHEGRLWLEHALSHSASKDHELYSWGIVWLALTNFYTSPRSFDLATEARQRFTLFNQTDGLALANLLLGIWAVARGEADKALDYLQQARHRFEEKQSLFFLGRTYFHLADALVLQGKRAQALQTYQLAAQVGADADGYSPFRWVWESMALLDPPRAMALCQSQLARQRQLQQQAKVAGLLQTLGHILTVAGDLPGALAALTESLTLWQQLGIDWHRGGGASRAYLDLALVHYLHQEHQAATAHAQQAIQRNQAAGDLHRVAYSYVALGYPALAVNDLPLAQTNFQRAIQTVAEQEIYSTYLALVGLAEIARLQGKLALAALLFGVTERFTRRPKPIADRWKEAYCRPLLTAAYAQLRHSAYATAWIEGQVMPFEQAMQVALTFELSGRMQDASPANPLS